MDRQSVCPALFITLVSLAAPQVRADESCNGLFEGLRTHLLHRPVLIHHTTNYDTSAQQFIGRSSQCWLDRMPGGSFSGSGLNCQRVIHRDGHSLGRSERIGYAISADGQMTFLQPPARYGPYPMSCFGGKFAVVNTGDSIETFVFVKR